MRLFAQQSCPIDFNADVCRLVRRFYEAGEVRLGVDKEDDSIASYCIDYCGLEPKMVDIYQYYIAEQHNFKCGIYTIYNICIYASR